LNNPSKWKEWYVVNKVKYDISTNGGTYDFVRGDIIKLDIDKNYYIARETKTLTIGQNWKQKDIEYGNTAGNPDNQIFVKITGNSGNNIIENKNVSFDETQQCYPKKVIGDRGYAVILGNGEVYVYVGENKLNTTYTGIDEENFIKIKDSTWD
jgi:hypothetical protein